MSGQSPRELLAQADKAKALAHWAESMRVTIRLGRPVKVSEMHQRGPFGRKRTYLFELDDRMPGPAVDALYRALAMVRDEANAEAYACEHLVTTRPDESARVDDHSQHADPTPDRPALDAARGES